MDKFKDEILKWAKIYANLGWFVFPLHSIDENGNCTCGSQSCTDQGKHPRLKRGLKEASRDLHLIEKWFGEDSEKSNIGIVAGECSGITIIDIDIGEGKHGEESWQAAIADHGEPNTLYAKTGSGGMHVFFKYSSSLKTSSNTLGRGIDCRNDNGYVVAPPSIHKSGGTYEWDNWGAELAFLPAHLSKKKDLRGRPPGKSKKKKRYSLGQVSNMLEFISSDDRDLWRKVGIILGREFKKSDEAWDIYNEWAEKAGVKKGRNHDEIMYEAFYEISQEEGSEQLSLGTIIHLAAENGWAPTQGEVPFDRFVYYGPGNNFIYRPTVTYWIASAVDKMVSPINDDGKIVAASEYISRNRGVTSLACDPRLEGDYIKGKNCVGGELLDDPGAAVYNTYRKSSITLGDHKLVKPFLDHVFKVFDKPGDADQFLDYMAHRVQRPWEKPRFALLIAGGQGVGKDTAIEFCCPAIGFHNVSSISPSDLDSNYNEYVTSTLIRINEAANLQDMSKWAFNERTKNLIAGNPDNISVNPKYGQKYTVIMFCGVIITTNHLLSGIYIPEDDRRYDVIESASLEQMGLSKRKDREQYFVDLWEWFLNDGDTHVAAYLHERDISKFSPAVGQRKTSAHHLVVSSSLSSDSWLIDALDFFNDRDYVRADWLIAKICEDGSKPEQIRPKLVGAMDRAGYSRCISYKHPLCSKDGRWKINGKFAIVYQKKGIAQIGSANGLSELPDYLFGEMGGF